MVSLSQILTWWGANKVPTVAQRNETFSSFRHKENKVAINDVDGLVDVLNSKQDKELAPVVLLDPGTAFFDMPANSVLDKIWFQLTTTTAGITVGKTIGADDVYQLQPTADNQIFFVGSIPFIAATRIYFNGIQADTVPIIYKS